MNLAIASHRIESAVFKPSPNHGGAFAAGLPDAIVLHFTAGSSAESAVDWLLNPQSKASAHVVIGRDGNIVQLVPFDTMAWHAGVSSFAGRSGYNRLSIGIEMDNPGRLRRTEGGEYISGFGRTYPADQVITAIHRNETAASHWLAYTEQQIDATFELCSALCVTYPVREILGHEEIAPGRKDDPGPAFPLERLRQRLILRGRDQEGAFQRPPPAERLVTAAALMRGFVTASKLNFRSAPSAIAEKVAPPLPQGTLVDILERRSGWSQVRVNGKVGWVKAEYVKTA